MIRTYFNIAFRIIRRNWSFTLINISGIAIGIATFVLIMLWVTDELNYDKFNTNYKNLYRVVENQFYAGGEVFPVAVTPAPLSAKIKEEYPEVKKSSRFASNWYTVKQGDKLITEEFSLVDPDFLNMFSVELIKGDKAKILTDPQSVIFTEALASKYFGKEDALGKTITIDKKEFVVTGIMKEFPKNSHYQVKSIIPFLYLKSVGENLEEWGNNSYWTYILLAQNTAIKSFNKKIKDLITRNNKGGGKTDIYAQHIGEIHLFSSGKFTAEIGSQGDIRYVRTLSLVAIFILLIACINFMNLSTAQSVKRAREVGMRKITGARRSRLILQFLAESVLMVLLADIIAMVIVESLLPMFNNLTAKELAIDYFSYNHLKSTLGIVLITGIVAGSYPAFFLSSFNPLKVLKGTFRSGKGAAIFRKVLVTGQFAISIILIIGTLVIASQLHYIQSKKLGYDRENLVYFYYGNEIKSHMQAFKQELLAEPGIQAVSSSNQVPTYIGNSTAGWNWEGKSSTENVLMHMVMVDEDYQKALRLTMAEGRFYTSEMMNDTTSVVINQTAARIISEKESAVGKFITYGPYRLNIIGVVNDFHFKSVHRKIEPLILVFLPKECYVSFVRIGPGNQEHYLKHIEKVYKKYSTEQPYFARFLDTELNNLYTAEKRMSVIFKYFAVLAIFISCLGLFGLSLYTAEQKTKEIGIRKTMGASVQSIVWLFLKQYFRWVAVATVIAMPIAWYTMEMWLNNFAYRISLKPTEFIVAAALAFFIAMLTVSYQAFKAASQNPVMSIKYE